ncbi:MAG: SOS response-associated peptidase [Eubacteriaceae bacterium]|jgi:putative SOS response-associated peptidase YedK|nr:SOS response-associated peptidase [Eubacteriaceae bacterium]
MCGRYYFGDLSDYPSLKEISLALTGHVFSVGEVFPTQNCAVLASGAGAGVAATVMQWGIRDYKGKLSLINARAETVREKPAFRRAFETGRIAVPMSSFFEWDASKKKLAFYRDPPEALFALGVSLTYPGSEKSKFAILTTQANESVLSVHARMPLLAEKRAVSQWILQRSAAEEMLSLVPKRLERRSA